MEESGQILEIETFIPMLLQVGGPLTRRCIEHWLYATALALSTGLWGVSNTLLCSAAVSHPLCALSAPVLALRAHAAASSRHPLQLWEAAAACRVFLCGKASSSHLPAVYRPHFVCPCSNSRMGAVAQSQCAATLSDVCVAPAAIGG